MFELQSARGRARSRTGGVDAGRGARRGAGRGRARLEPARNAIVGELARHFFSQFWSNKFRIQPAL